MRLYRPRNLEDQTRVVGMIHKKDVRKWLEEHEPVPVVDQSDTRNP